MLTTRPLGRNETFSPTASNYGFGGATCGHGSRVVATLGTLLVDRRFPQGKICKKSLQWISHVNILSIQVSCIARG